MGLTRTPGGGPWRVGIPVADSSAGLLAAQGVLVALLEREHSGEGQWVHTSLLKAIRDARFSSHSLAHWQRDPDKQGTIIRPVSQPELLG